MSVDITMQAAQDEIANSLLGPEVEQQAPEAEASEFAVAGDDLLNEAIAEQEENTFLYGDEGMEARRAERPETEARQPQERQPQERLRSERAPQENEQQEQPHAPTPEEVRAGVERLDAAVRDYGLNEPADALKDGQEFCAAFGTDVYKTGMDVGALGSVRGKAAVSALLVYDATGGDVSKLGGIPPQNAQAFSHDVIKAMGLDPRSTPHDAMLLSRTYLGGYMNLIRTCEAYGWDKNRLAQINDGDTAEFYLRNFQKAFGVEEKPKEQMAAEERQAYRDKAVKFADANANHLFRIRERILQANAQRNEQRQPRSRGQRGGQRIPAKFRDGIKGSRVPTFRSNLDIFSGEAVTAAMSQKL